MFQLKEKDNQNLLSFMLLLRAISNIQNFQKVESEQKEYSMQNHLLKIDYCQYINIKIYIKVKFY